MRECIASTYTGRVELKGVEELKHSEALMDVEFKHYEALDGEG